ncbi:MAG: 4-oxalocrotonate tautomerase family protein [Glaciimonas sp.]|nr:4-oxalocrotonate tautomerase family protein [Glaciimonas sp.]
MPLITVSMFPGRSDEQKATLVRLLTDVFLKCCGGNWDGVWVMLEEISKQHWAFGGKLRSDPDAKPAEYSQGK